MEFIVSASELLGKLNTIKGVINSKNTLSILDNFLFTLKDNTLKIEATDIETCMETSLTLENVNGGGVIAINAKELTDMLSLFPDVPLTFKIDLTTYQIDILSASGKYTIGGVDGEDFPKKMPIEGEKSSFSIAPESLQKGISSTLFATSDDDARPQLTGIYFELKPEHLRFVSTDSHKLARYTRTDVHSEKEAQFIIPKKTATILKSLLLKESTPVTVEFDDKQVSFSCESFVLNSRLIAAKYPNYAAVIPAENNNVLTVNKMDFYKTLRRVSFFANATTNLTCLDIMGNNLKVTARNLDKVSEAKEEVNCQYAGEDMKIGFKSKFLLNILDNIDCENVSIRLSDPTRAGLIVPEDKMEENEEVLMLLMPMMI